MSTICYDFLEDCVFVDTADLDKWSDFSAVCKTAAVILKDDRYSDPVKVIRDAIELTAQSPEVIYYFVCIMVSVVLEQTIKDITAEIRRASEGAQNDRQENIPG